MDNGSEVEEVELWGADESSFLAQGVGREPVAEKGVDEDLKVLTDRGSTDAAFAGDVGAVQEFTVRDGRHFEEAAESGDIATERLGGDFVFEIVADIGGEKFAGVCVKVMPWQEAAVQGKGERIVRYLSETERSEFIANGTAAEQIGVVALKFARAGAAEHKANAVVFDQAVDFVK